MGSGVPRGLRIWAVLARAGLRTTLQYRANFVLGVLGGLALQGMGLAFIGTVMSRFATIGGWTLPEIVLLYGMRLTSHALWTIPCSPLMYMDRLVQRAEFDCFLTRPVNPLVQVITTRPSITTVADLVGGVATLTAGLVLAPVRWSPLLVLLLPFALAGGALVELSFQLASSALAFRMLSTLSLKLAVDNAFNTIGNYPIKIFGPVARWGMTCAFPLAFASYFPTTVLLDRTGELWIPPWLAVAAPAVGLLLFLAAYRFWFGQLRHYTSGGG
ncbi:ABC transporter permease [Streptacidiphilus sp. MAP5-3]|uniref:ABC transporter permease n=1 Tax=unclassified Streptacidiphilus TaxID=2643834 RepID=UPI0035184E2E